MILFKIIKSIYFKVTAKILKSPDKSLQYFRNCCSQLDKIFDTPFFVKVGANDGVTADPCADILLSNDAWKGILIEPVPDYFEKLKEHFGDNKRFLLERVAIGKFSEARKFYYISQSVLNNHPELPLWFDKIGSFDKTHLLKHLDGYPELPVNQTFVPTIPLSKLLKQKKIRDVHFLSIDAEGADLEVLKTFNFSDYCPPIVFIEHKHHSEQDKKEMKGLLKKHQYKIFDCGSDYFALHADVKKAMENLGK